MIKDDEDEAAPITSTSRSSPAPEAEVILEDHKGIVNGDGSETNVTEASQVVEPPKKAAKKLYDEEKRAVGRIARDIWLMYLKACGTWLYWIVFLSIFILASITPVFNNGWLR